MPLVYGEELRKTAATGHEALEPRMLDLTTYVSRAGPNLTEKIEGRAGICDALFVNCAI